MYYLPSTIRLCVSQCERVGATSTSVFTQLDVCVSACKLLQWGPTHCGNGTVVAEQPDGF